MSDTAARETSKVDSSPTQEAKQTPAAPPDTPTEIWTRRSILAAFWAVVILLGLPHWLWTTSVYRAQLDVAAASRWIDGEACDLKYRITVVVSHDKQTQDSARVAFTSSLQSMLNADLEPYHYAVVDSTQWTSSANDADLLVNISPSSNAKDTAAQTATLQIQCDSVTTDEARDTCVRAAADSIKSTTAEEMKALAFLVKDSPYSQQVQYPINDVSELEKTSTRAFKYASSYHLTFSLFTASSTPSSWDIESALQHYIKPLLSSLAPISNFTIDTQIQYYASFSTSMIGPHFNEETQTWQLNEKDLSGFINAAEWPLNPSIDAGPTINFVLYVPSTKRSPLQVVNSATNSWTIPQWGGVQILNRPELSTLGTAELESVMYTFADQLTALLGLPKRPASLQLRIKALTRQRVASLIVSSSDTLGALIRLTGKLEQIAIPQSVAQAVSSAVADLDLACHSLHVGQHKDALLYARRADEAVERAFFEPSMVGQVYFPDEHKVAVYVPLLGPMAVPLLMATIKEIKQWRQSKIKTN